jgi:hypothetical protein
VRGPDPDANLGSGAGFLYETLAATGPVSLSGTLNLIVHEGFTIPTSGMTLPLIFSSGAISGNFSSIQITDAQTKLTRTGTILSQTVRNQTNPGTGQATNMLVITFQ